MPDALPSIAADPYSWPFDGKWRANGSALLLLGFQHAVVDALDAQTETAIAARLTAAVNARNMLVVASRRGRVASGSTILKRRMRLEDAAPEPETAGWQLAGALDLPAATPVFDHAGDNAFYGTGLEAMLSARGIRNLLICGLPTEGLVHATQRNANDMGFECLAIADACKGTSEDKHSGQLRITKFGNGLFGAVATSEAVLRSVLEK
ncbi:cysteine hydrolase [Roseibium aggregatum]|uniref:Isochorismatase family protein YecD n=1 Tax=Roseibium aggregatum TaxID=187304 RepID=A0A0M6YDC5_9HYPH|nr:cysteine hydrolase [Roseibium aggregatum]CTQ47429.1 Isochorismatase family protein YecD [Roseibium aggregatum]